MPNILTESLRLKNLNNLVNTLNTQSVYFSFSGPVTVTNPTQPQDSYGINADVFSDALYLKKITSTNFVNVIPNYGWISGARYQQFDSTVDISTLTTVQSFIPATATATVSGGSLIITVTNPGSGYTSVPSVTFSFGTAVATATISAGSVTAIVITSGNSGYSTAPTISISAPSIIQSTAFDMQPFYVITPQYRVYKCLNNNSGAISTVLPTSISTSASTPAALADGYVWKYMYTLSTIDQEFFYTTNWIPVRYITVNDGSDQWTIQQNAIAGSSPYHGANAVAELGGTNLMVKVRVNGSEGGQIVDTSQYSQIGLVSNPIQSGSYWTSYGGATGPNALQLAAGHAAAIGATIYFGSDNSTRQIVEVAKAFEEAHQLGMATILWCYTRNNAFKKDGVDYHVSADLTGQANHLGVTIQADIIKQKLAENNGGYKALNTGGSSYGKLDERIYTELTSNHPIDLVRYQVANCYMGRAGLINSGGPSGKNDLAQAALTAVINKRAGGTGIISGRKAFQKPRKEGVDLLHTIQDVYLDKSVTIA